LNILRLCDWSIEAIGKNFDITLDLIAGHISQKSYYFEDYPKNGEKSEYADMFLTAKKAYPDGKITLEEIQKLDYLTQTLPFINVKLDSGCLLYTSPSPRD